MKVGILISGGGSNMVALVNAMQAGRVSATPALVLSNRPGAAGLAKARALGVPVAIVDHTAFPSRRAFDSGVHRTLRAHHVDMVCLAGFMRILGRRMVGTWQGNMLNIHPSLLPKYRGLNTHARAIEAGDTEAGATVHRVTAELDDGPILAQARVPILSGDTPDTLAARVLKEEHRIYPQALAQALRERLGMPPEPPI
ncbi:MAG: phosphoribosylglycinamide formyltransferase [Pseudomonadota bacterium]